MKKVAIFGNAGGGKSTLARRLAEITGLPLYPIDIVKTRHGDANYRTLHAELLKQDCWIIDGYDSVAQCWERFAAADTLIYIDLPLTTHFRWITKRLIQGQFRTPEGWPPNTPIWHSTLSGYRVLWLCHRHLTPRYRNFVAEAASSKRVHHLKSPAQIDAFLRSVLLGGHGAGGGASNPSH